MNQAWQAGMVGALLLLMGCQNRPGAEAPLPPQVGRGLSRTDSLHAIREWLQGRTDYPAETLRILTLYKLTEALASKAPDSAARVYAVLRAQAARTAYPLAQGLLLLAQAQLWDGQGRYDSVSVYAREAAHHFEKVGRTEWAGMGYHIAGLGYHQAGEIKTAMDYYLGGMRLFELLKDTVRLTSSTIISELPARA